MFSMSDLLIHCIDMVWMGDTLICFHATVTLLQAQDRQCLHKITICEGKAMR